MEPIEFFIKKIENERKIRLPICFLNDKGLKELNRLLNNKVAIGISLFYQKPEKFISFEPFKLVQEKLKTKRNLTKTDKELIKNLIKIKNTDPNLFFDFVGNLFYISNLIDEMNSYDNLSENIEVSLILFIFINMVEIINWHIAELLKMYLSNNKIKDSFTNLFKKGKHPTIGNTLNTLEKHKFLDEKKKSVFNENRIIRNKIAHGNIFYDNKNKCIYTTFGKEFKKEQLKEEFKQIHNFLLELIFQYNKKNGDLLTKTKSLFKKLSKEFLKIQRNPNLRKFFQNYIFEWER